MDRRNIFRGLFAGLAGAGIATAARAATPPGPDAARVVYHLSEQDRVLFALGNITNHFEGMGGGGNVRIAIVALGPGVRPFVRASADEALKKRLTPLVKEGLEMWACANTLQGMKLTVDDLLPGFRSADKGGVVKLAEMQSQGWAYLRP
jgi:intracellular sulfur oxidation DsrE/DsrF family protein